MAMTYNDFLAKYRGKINPATQLAWTYAEMAGATNTPVDQLVRYGTFTQNFAFLTKKRTGVEPTDAELVKEWDRLASEPTMPPAATSGVVPFDAQAITKLTVRELKQLLHESNVECVALLRTALKL